MKMKNRLVNVNRMQVFFFSDQKLKYPKKKKNSVEIERKIGNKRFETLLFFEKVIFFGYLILSY